MLTSLTKLSLSNNLIEKIENLDALVNLNELDLSFNKIKKIENLNTLVNIEILSIFENEINMLQNLDSLKKLLIFTAGRNRIVDRNNVRSTVCVAISFANKFKLNFLKIRLVILLILFLGVIFKTIHKITVGESGGKSMC